MTQITQKFPMSRPMMIGLLALGILVGRFGGWATLTEISGAIVASGQIEVDQNRQVVQHPDGGVVKDIYVEEGDAVSVGDVLISLDPSIEESELSIIQGQVFELMARRGRLTAERDGIGAITFDPRLIERAKTDAGIAELMQGQENLFQARVASNAKQIEQLTKRKSQIANQIDGIVAQRAAVATQLDLIEQELADQQKLLDRGLAQASRVLALQRSQAELSGDVGDLIAKQAESEGRITDLDIQIEGLETTRREDAISRLRDQQYRTLELEERAGALIEKLMRMDIRAPVSGIVYGLSVFTPRSVIRPADPVMFLIPQDRPLVITVQVPPIDIDQVYVGQNAVLRFSALDQRTTPELFGKVTKVSPDAFQDDASRMSYYRAEILLNEGETDRLPANVTLIPGMPVEAFIRTQDRTPLAYLIKPLADYFAKAFREN
jgi:HlyD family type I secretion membrane fusion protein